MLTSSECILFTFTQNCDCNDDEGERNTAQLTVYNLIESGEPDCPECDTAWLLSDTCEVRA